MNTAEIDEAYREKRDGWEENLRIRVHRSVSWLKSAEKYSDDVDIEFMSCVNAINALWGIQMMADKDAIKRLCKILSENGTSSKRIASAFSSAEGSQWLQMLINNKHLYWQYWMFLNGEMNENEFKVKARNFKAYALKAIETRKYEYLLSSALHQVIALRGQVFHGFTTYQSKANREILQLSSKMLRKFTGIILSEMMDKPNIDWGQTPWTFGMENQPAYESK